MSFITVKLIKELRDKTGKGMMECKKALAETEGDMSKAIDWLRQQEIVSTEKKSGRVSIEEDLLRLLPKDLQQLTQDDLIDRLKNISLEEKIFELLAHSSNWKIRYSISLNPYTPIKVLQNLITDTDKKVKAAFKERELPHDWKTLDFDETLNKLNEGSVDEIILRSLLRSKSIEQRKALAISSNTPPLILQQLSKDKSAVVVYAATVARKLPIELARLDKDTLINKIN